MSHCSTATHMVRPASSQLNLSRRSSTTLTNGILTRSSTLRDSTGSSIILYNMQVLVIERPAGNLWRICGMWKNLSRNFTESSQESLDDDWICRSRIARFLLIFYFAYFLWISGLFKWHQHGFLQPTTTSGVSLCTKTTKRILIEH